MKDDYKRLSSEWGSKRRKADSRQRKSTFRKLDPEDRAAEKCEWPAECHPWRHERPPQLPVVMIAVRDTEGVTYEVRVSDGNPHAFEEGEDQVSVWSTYRQFGQADAMRAGGASFRYAARQQQEIADKLVAYIEVREP